MNTKTLILISEFETALKNVNKNRIIEFFEETHQVGQIRYELPTEEGFTYEILVSTLDELIRAINAGEGSIDASNDFVMKITYDVEVTKTYHIHE